MGYKHSPVRAKLASLHKRTRAELINLVKLRAPPHSNFTYVVALECFVPSRIVAPRFTIALEIPTGLYPPPTLKRRRFARFLLPAIAKFLECPPALASYQGLDCTEK
jgi:hypothetical protein